jgi:hypothetical protein
VDLVFEVAYWKLSTVCCWSSIGSTVSDTILGRCLLLSDPRPGVFIRLIDGWVSSEFSGVNTLSWGPSEFVSEVDLPSMLSVLRRCLSNGELAVARTIRVRLTRVNGWWCHFVVDCCQPVVEVHQTLFLRWICELNSVLFLAFRQWHWYHSLFVTIVRFLGSLMAQGSVLGGCCSCCFWSNTFCCDDVVKTENLDWIFLLDVSLLWGWPVDASVLLSTSGDLTWCDLLAFCCQDRSSHWIYQLLVAGVEPLSQYLSVFQVCEYFSGYLLHVCRFSCENLF